MRGKEKEKVLIVEDNTAQRRILKTNLDNMGFEVVEASSKEDAFEQIATHHFDLALLDIALHSDDDFDGIEVGERLLEIPVPVIYLTSMGDKHFEKARKKTVYALWEEKLDKVFIISFSAFNRKVTQFLEDCRTGNRKYYDAANTFADYGSGLVAKDKVVYVRSEKGNLYIQLAILENEGIIIKKMSLVIFSAAPQNLLPTFIQVNRNLIINTQYAINLGNSKRRRDISKESKVTLQYNDKVEKFKVSRDRYPSVYEALIP